jgi:hypothetical protein
MPGQTQPQRPAGWYRSMEPAWATEHYGFPVDPNHGDTYTATDNSEWTFDLLSFGEWDLSRYSPEEEETGIRLFGDAARKAPARDQAPREQLAEIVKNETGMAYTSKVAADRIISAGWRPPARVIADPADLDALPVGSVVYARSKAYTAAPDFDDETAIVWLKPGAVWTVTSEEALEHARGSVTLLHTPEDGDAE